MVMTKYQVVYGIIAVFSDETKWCQKYPALDAKGRATYPTDPNATAWCIYGAGRKVMNLGVGELSGRPEDPEHMRAAHGVFWGVMKDIGQYDPYRPTTGSIALFNDTHTFDEVMERLCDVCRAYYYDQGVPMAQLMSFDEQGVRA